MTAEIAPQPNSTSQEKKRTDWQRIVGLARPERVTLIAGTLALFISTGTSLVAPSLVGFLVDGVSEGTGRAGINRAAMWLLVVFGVSGFATALRSYWFTVAGERVVARLRGRLYAAVILREISFFDERTDSRKGKVFAFCYVILALL